MQFTNFATAISGRPFKILKICHKIRNQRLRKLFCTQFQEIILKNFVNNEIFRKNRYFFVFMIIQLFYVLLLLRYPKNAKNRQL